MTRIHPFRRIAATALVAVAALGVTAACTKDDAPSGAAASTGPEPETIDGARAAAQTVFDRFSEGDFAGAWDMYTTAGQAAISQADYVKLNQACTRKGLGIQLASVRMDATDRATVIAKQLAATRPYTMIYETGAWKLQPAPDGLALYSLGAVQAIAAQKRAGTCAGSGA
jgi:hypothetical protein